MMWNQYESNTELHMGAMIGTYLKENYPLRFRPARVGTHKMMIVEPLHNKVICWIRIYRPNGDCETHTIDFHNPHSFNEFGKIIETHNYPIFVYMNRDVWVK